MNENLDPTDSGFNNEELEIDKALRPLSFDDFAGQDQILNNLKVFVEACNQRLDALDHTLFHGPPGLGKTTLAHIVANELGVNLKVTSGPVLDKPGDLADNYPGFEEGQEFFEGRSVDHTLVYDNLNYEQFRWDNRNLYYYINSEGEFIIVTNSTHTYTDTDSSAGIE